MKVLYNWLKEFVDLTAPPEDLRTRLSLSGTAVEALEQTAAGPMLDAELTSQVYLELLGGRQKKLSLSPIDRADTLEPGGRTARARPVPLASRLSDAEAAAHADFVDKELGKDAFWKLGSGGS